MKKYFAVGQQWKTRDGSIVSIKTIVNGARYPIHIQYMDGSKKWLTFSMDGEYQIGNYNHPYDLVEIVCNTTPTPRSYTEDEIRIVLGEMHFSASYMNVFIQSLNINQEANKKRREADYAEYLRLKQIFEKA